jgi:hypothetical protein
MQNPRELEQHFRHQVRGTLLSALDRNRLADPKSEVPEEKRQKILSNIRVIRDRWWPFKVEAVPADAKSK